jgi:hypothetical protein
MIETSRTGRRALAASVLGGVLWCGLCSFGGVSEPGLVRRAEAPLRAPLEWSLSPDGEWLAISAARGRRDQYDAWVVAVADGAQRELEQVERAAPQLCFDELGRLRLYTVDAARGTPALLWIDPGEGSVLDSTRDRTRIRTELEPLVHGWARVEARRSDDGLAPRRVEWPAHPARFELDPKRDVELALSEVEGVVHYTRRVGDQLRLVRRDLRHGSETTLVVEGRGLLTWRLSEDGRSVALVERGVESRIRVIDAASGALVAGPWLGEDVEWAPGGGSRHVVMTIGPQRRLVDTLLDKSQPAGAWERFAVLDDGMVVAEVEQELVLFDAELTEVRVLFQRPDDGAQVARER